MNNAGNTAKNALARLSESGERPTTGSRSAAAIEASDLRAANVWKTMGEIYGPAFAAAYGDAPSKVWTSMIADLTDEQCAAGFQRLVKERRRFPPNVTEFLDACIPQSDGVRYLGVPLTPEQKRLMLESKKADPEVAARHLASMRAKVRA